jgi:hypothetical protein
MLLRLINNALLLCLLPALQKEFFEKSGKPLDTKQ